MFTLTKEFRFEAAHALPQLPSEHKCHRLHGHSYRIELEMRAGAMDDRGFAGGVDYADMDAFGWIVESLDHRNLNEVHQWADTLRGGPTAEFLAVWLYGKALEIWPQETVAAVRVHETPKTCVEYRP